MVTTSRVARTPARGVSAVGRLGARISEAEQAEAAPRQKVQELDGALAAAVLAERFGDAERLKGELHEARVDLALRQAETAALREGQAALEQARQDTDRTLREAEEQAGARQAIEVAGEIERQAQAQIDAALSEMWAWLAEAKDAYARAIAAQSVIAEARRSVVAARSVLEPLPPGHTYPVPAGENRVIVLQDNSPLIRELVGWAR